MPGARNKHRPPRMRLAARGGLGGQDSPSSLAFPSFPVFQTLGAPQPPESPSRSHRLPFWDPRLACPVPPDSAELRRQECGHASGGATPKTGPGGAKERRPNPPSPSPQNSRRHVPTHSPFLSRALQQPLRVSHQGTVPTTPPRHPRKDPERPPHTHVGTPQHARRAGPAPRLWFLHCAVSDRSGRSHVVTSLEADCNGHQTCPADGQELRVTAPPVPASRVHRGQGALAPAGLGAQPSRVPPTVFPDSRNPARLTAKQANKQTSGTSPRTRKSHVPAALAGDPGATLPRAPLSPHRSPFQADPNRPHTATLEPRAGVRANSFHASCTPRSLPPLSPLPPQGPRNQTQRERGRRCPERWAPPVSGSVGLGAAENLLVYQVPAGEA